jgi:hypothetical protein
MAVRQAGVSGVRPTASRACKLGGVPACADLGLWNEGELVPKLCGG